MTPNLTEMPIVLDLSFCIKTEITMTNDPH